MKKRIIDTMRRAGQLGVVFSAYEALKTIDPRNVLRNARYCVMKAPDGMLIPPIRLIVAVAGHSDIQLFLEGGRAAMESMISILAKNGIDAINFQRILDFGCGCGRVTRHWNSLQQDVSIFGTDYNRKLVEWCERNLTFARFDSNQLLPPLRYEDRTFDLIYALSVFTHLPESLQHRWIDELFRILKPGGYLFITAHGKHYLEMLAASERNDFEAGQLVVRYQEAAGTNMCSAFHSEEYVRGKLAKSFEVVDYVPEGAKGNPYQDVYLLRRPAS